MPPEVKNRVISGLTKTLMALSGEGYWSQVFTFPLFNHSVSNRLKITSDVTC